MSTFQFMTFTELMAQPDETREHSYRRGYRSGYMAALQHVYCNQTIPSRFWNHWNNTLLRWANNVNGIELPPQMGDQA